MHIGKRAQVDLVPPRIVRLVDQPATVRRQSASGFVKWCLEQHLLASLAFEGEHAEEWFVVRLAEDVPIPDLLRVRVAVARRAAFDNICDPHICAGHASLFEQLIEELSGRADEGSSLLIFTRTRSLADEHDFGAQRPLAGHSLGSRFRKLAQGPRLALLVEFLVIGVFGHGNLSIHSLFRR